MPDASPFQPRPIDGVIFDMDGLLLDSETLANEALVGAGASLGVDIPPAFCRRLVGVPADGCRVLVREAYGPDFPLETFFARQEAHLSALVAAGRLVLKAGVEPLLDYLDRQCLPRAIATSSSRSRTDHHLAQVGLDRRFDAIVTRDDVTHGKPDPEPYLTAARRIGQAPERCLALEDSHSGARAAHAAGIPVIVVPDLLDPTEDIRAKALAVMDDLHAVLDYVRHARAAHPS
ncbi:HAD family phosphatase [Nguyenibacter sp. L1]|uniref:HAD family hydrolase n=1 Tax=Nguyenibacter sp. L1 TaxID=3049350 RepID=UPI002B45B39F|nr:HAD family phosphatase [Nguyenibacter sp. L1]WRH87227.1 HAD family phosphatase [Nguyenibacter sp. L1]